MRISPGTDLAAHFGGFVTGLAFGAGLVFVPEKFQQNWKVNLLTGIVFLGWLGLVWGLALTRRN